MLQINIYRTLIYLFFCFDKCVNYDVMCIMHDNHIYVYVYICNV